MHITIQNDKVRAVVDTFGGELIEEEFQDYEIAFDKPLTLSAYFTPDDSPIGKVQLSSLIKNTDTLSLSYDLFKKGAVIIDQIGSHNLQLRHRQNHRGVSFAYDGFPVLAFGLQL